MASLIHKIPRKTRRINKVGGSVDPKGPPTEARAERRSFNVLAERHHHHHNHHHEHHHDHDHVHDYVRGSDAVLITHLIKSTTSPARHSPFPAMTTRTYRPNSATPWHGTWTLSSAVTHCCFLGFSLRRKMRALPMHLNIPSATCPTTALQNIEKCRKI